MPGIGDYIGWSRVVLAEGGKYFSLLLVSVLAIRLWRNGLKVHGSLRSKNLLLAGCASVLAVIIGWFSMENSMGKLYLHYAMQAFDAGRAEQAYSLFDSSAGFWPGPDATGGKGVCLLLLGRTDAGESLLQKANSQRKGRSSPFEEFYLGLAYFMRNDQEKALPLLQGASADSRYQWSIVKFFAIMDLDSNHPAAAAQLMKPFMSVDVTESDQAYVVASLQLAAGKKTEAQALVDKFSAPGLPPFWKSRFDRLQEQIKSR